MWKSSPSAGPKDGEEGPQAESTTKGKTAFIIYLAFWALYKYMFSSQTSPWNYWYDRVSYIFIFIL